MKNTLAEELARISHESARLKYPDRNMKPWETLTENDPDRLEIHIYAMGQVLDHLASMEVPSVEELEKHVIETIGRTSSTLEKVDAVRNAIAAPLQARIEKLSLVNQGAQVALDGAVARAAELEAKLEAVKALPAHWRLWRKGWALAEQVCASELEIALFTPAAPQVPEIPKCTCGGLQMSACPYCGDPSFTQEHHTPPAGLVLHNPDNLTPEQVGPKHRLCCTAEYTDEVKAEYWHGNGWWIAGRVFERRFETCKYSYRVPLSTPWPEVKAEEKPEKWEGGAAKAAGIAEALGNVKPQPGTISEAEQRAFDSWVERNTPSGDVTSVWYQWEQSSAFQDFLEEQKQPEQPTPDALSVALDRIKELEAQMTRMKWITEKSIEMVNRDGTTAENLPSAINAKIMERDAFHKKTMDERDKLERFYKEIVKECGDDLVLKRLRDMTASRDDWKERHDSIKRMLSDAMNELRELMRKNGTLSDRCHELEAEAAGAEHELKIQRDYRTILESRLAMLTPRSVDVKPTAEDGSILVWWDKDGLPGCSQGELPHKAVGWLSNKHLAKFLPKPGERETFEDQFPNMPKERTPSDMYPSEKTQAMWDAWQARAGKEGK